MNVFERLRWNPALILLGVLFMPGECALALSQEPDHIPGAPWSEPILPRSSAFLENPGRPADTGERTSRVMLFRMPPGFLQSPVGLDSDDDLTSSEPDASMPADPRIQLSMGADNPFFDFQGPGDLGGVGYYRVYTQYQVFDSPSTGITLGLQAATPAGLECEGVAGGPTILNPTIAWFHELDHGLAIQGFVGKKLAARAHWADSLERSLHYGVALQSPLPILGPTSNQNIYMFVEALGRSGFGPDVGQGSGTGFELLPGLHWHFAENWWMRGGVLLPVDTPRFESHLLHLTCFWRF